MHVFIPKMAFSLEDGRLHIEIPGAGGGLGTPLCAKADFLPAPLSDPHPQFPEGTVDHNGTHDSAVEDVELSDASDVDEEEDYSVARDDDEYRPAEDAIRDLRNQQAQVGVCPAGGNGRGGPLWRILAHPRTPAPHRPCPSA